mmetsp:Transcript_112/g.297  ORF Transcript_112/g.297 Transcript_112/m.297 type:complete len:208 (-) Transcript_112:195-818(-)
MKKPQGGTPGRRGNFLLFRPWALSRWTSFADCSNCSCCCRTWAASACRASCISAMASACICASASCIACASARACASAICCCCWRMACSCWALASSWASTWALLWASSVSATCCCASSASFVGAKGGSSWSAASEASRACLNTAMASAWPHVLACLASLGCSGSASAREDAHSPWAACSRFPSAERRESICCWISSPFLFRDAIVSA